MLLKKYITGKVPYTELVKWILSDLKHIDKMYNSAVCADEFIDNIKLSYEDMKDLKVIPDILMIDGVLTYGEDGEVGMHSELKGLLSNKDIIRSVWYSILEIYSFICVENNIIIREEYEQCEDDKKCYKFVPLCNGGKVCVYKYLNRISLWTLDYKNNKEFVESILLKSSKDAENKIFNVIIRKCVDDIKTYGLRKLLVKSNCITLEMYILSKFKNILSKFASSCHNISIPIERAAELIIREVTDNEYFNY